MKSDHAFTKILILSEFLSNFRKRVIRQSKLRVNFYDINCRDIYKIFAMADNSACRV